MDGGTRRDLEDGAVEDGSPRDHGIGRDFVGSLERGMSVLEALSHHAEGLSLSEAAKETGLTRATARRFLLTLTALGYVRQSRRAFHLTPKILTLSRRLLDGGSLWAHAEPILREASERAGESCSAGMLDGESVVYVARVRGPRVMSVSLDIGSRLPAHCTSMGRVLLSELEPDRLGAFLAAADIRPLTPRTVTDREKLYAIIRQVREDGYALVDEELELGLRSISTPVRDSGTGEIVAAVNMSTHAGRHTADEMRERLLPILLDAARGIECYARV